MILEQVSVSYPRRFLTSSTIKTLMPTSMCLQLADQSVFYPTGITENILVKIRNFFVLVDFLVLDMQEDMKNPLFLEDPF
jgi:hypothetical protein